MSEQLSHTSLEELPTKRRPSLKINALSNWILLGINVCAGLFLTPYVIRHIMREGYGVWTLIGSLVGYFGLLRLGVGSAVIRYVPLI